MARISSGGRREIKEEDRTERKEDESRREKIVKKRWERRRGKGKGGKERPKRLRRSKHGV